MKDPVSSDFDEVPDLDALPAGATVGDRLFDLGAAVVLTCALLGAAWLMGQQLVSNVGALAGGSGLLVILATLVLAHTLLALAGGTLLALGACAVAAWRLKTTLAPQRRDLLASQP